MIPGGWNSQREDSNVQNNPGSIEGALEKKIMITGGCNSQRKVNITLQDPGHIDNIMKEKKLFLVDRVGRERPANSKGS